ncbi:hypothetical protein IC619_006865 [Hazenella sp. IB182353]|uniref:hypothetical protein n=1 Tax=Polycladospora coralii TaxID=2771432 RepID=UPI001745F034|nr:hypothetical protein [Polycladospora coralii]MBS7530200.1 hypothetical protein [Polycladospora coralii]MBS7530212.1 hypothetical protein [Polycladospora coralii]
MGWFWEGTEAEGKKKIKQLGHMADYHYEEMERYEQLGKKRKAQKEYLKARDCSKKQVYVDGRSKGWW